MPGEKPALLQEELGGDPWKMVVVCLLLNRTTGTQVRGVLGGLFAKYPDAASMSRAGAGLERVVKSLGLWRRRAALLRSMSKAWARGGWQDPAELPGVGEYCLDSWAIFIEGDRGVRPGDSRLAPYAAWLRCGGDNSRLVARYRRNLRQQRGGRRC